MKYSCVILLLWTAGLAGQEKAPGAATVESVAIIGAQNYSLSQELVQQIQRLTGQTFDPQALDALAKSLGNELGDYSVTQKVSPGDKPEHVKVVFEVSPRTEAFAESKAETNVNSRYTVEDVEIRGADRHKLSKGIIEELHKLIGKKFNQEILDELVSRIRRELHARSVSHRVTRGEKPEHVKVVLEVSRDREDLHQVQLSKFLYHSKQGWSAKAVGDFEIAPDTGVLFGLVSDGDDLLERYAGLVAGFGTRKVVTDRLRLRSLFETYHHLWNNATLSALESGTADVPGLYRTRKNFQPMVTVLLARPLAISAGTSFQFIQTQFPTARTEAANAAVGGIHYLQRFEDAGGIRHEVEAGYDLRAATRTFESDFAYTRHQWNFAYRISGHRQAVVARFNAGRINGRAPLFDRFVLGNSTTLRGWHKFEVAPLGGDRVVHNSLEYHHALGHDGDDPTSLVVFYDAGAVWNQGERAVAKHAMGVGAKFLVAGLLAVAFPIKSGRMEPLFMVGAKF